MDYISNYNLWLEKTVLDKEINKELLDIKNDDKEIKERFYKDLEFGTAGLRGEMGAGTNRINIYTIKKVTQGFCDYLKSKYEKPSVAISFDSRLKSDEFAKASCEVFLGNNIKVYITDKLMPTPFLSFLVRNKNCSGGVMITASHNPYIYNGYKVYDETGAQVMDEACKEIFSYIEKVDIFYSIKSKDFETCKKADEVEIISSKTYDEYIDTVLFKDITKEEDYCKNLKIAYTPLNGAGFDCVSTVFKRLGFEDVKVVSEQKEPNGLFPTCQYPNPENKDAIKLVLKLAKENESDIVLATDPDSDRVGLCVRNDDGEYVILNGNEIGLLLFDYVLENKIKKYPLGKPYICVKTIVSSRLIDVICEQNGVECINVLTGFKYIGGEIEKLFQQNEEERFAFGYEESFGYLTDGFVRDKDAVLSCMHICKMASIYKKNGINLLQKLDDIYNSYGYFLTTQKSFDFSGLEGQEKLKKLMDVFRFDYNKLDFNFKVKEFKDYLSGYNGLPKSNVIEFVFDNGSSLLIRPSGTEPKIKFYINANCKTCEENKVILEKLSLVCENIIKMV